MNHVNLTALKECIPELLALNTERADAALKFTAGIESVSKATFVDKSILRKVIKALAADKTEDTKSEADNISELLVEPQEFAGAE
jgi:hypothetical protein